MAPPSWFTRCARSHWKMRDGDWKRVSYEGTSHLDCSASARIKKEHSWQSGRKCTHEVIQQEEQLLKKTPKLNSLLHYYFSGSRSPPVRSTSLGDVSPRREPAFPGLEEIPSAGGPPPISLVLAVGVPGEEPISTGPQASDTLVSGDATQESTGAMTSPTQAYVAECDSIESLGMEENSALLKEEEKSKSENSLLIFFDGTDVQDTCVWNTCDVTQIRATSSTSVNLSWRLFCAFEAKVDVLCRLHAAA